MQGGNNKDGRLGKGRNLLNFVLQNVAQYTGGPSLFTIWRLLQGVVFIIVGLAEGGCWAYVCFGLFVVFSHNGTSLSAMVLFGAAVDRFLGKKDITTLAALFVAAIANTCVAYVEISAEHEKRELHTWLTRRQCNNPKALEDFVPYCAENMENPFPWYKALRAEAPVYEVPGHGYFVISNYHDVQKICKDTQAYSSNLVAILLNGGGTINTLVRPDLLGQVGVVDVLALADPPIHTAQRKLAFAGMSPKMFASLEGKIRSLAVDMLAALQQDGSTFDWMQEFAMQVS
jgi:hypothetical protein